jgi:membrane protein
MAVAEARGGEMAWPGLQGFAVEFYRRVIDDRVLAISAGVTFYALLAIFPAIAAGVSLFGLVQNLDKVSYDLSRLSALLPGGAIDIIGEQIRRTVAKGHDTLGFAAVTGFLLSVWSANAGIKSLFDALNIVLKETEKRGFVRLNIISLLFTFGALVTVVLAALLLMWSSSWIERAGPYLFWPLAALGLAALWSALTFFVALLYRFGPSGNDIPWRWITWGSAATATIWLCFSGAFSWYAANFGSFDKTYGSLGAAIGFMLWIWLSVVVILCGEEINEILENGKKGGRPASLPKKRRR